MKMKRFNHKQIIVCLLCLFLAGCITPFEPARLPESNQILVVEGIILEPSGTNIKLSRTKAFDSQEEGYVRINGATVSVVCSDGTSFPLEAHPQNEGEYVLASELLFKDGAMYAIEIRVDGKQYRSGYAAPLRTPPIGEVSYTTSGDGKQVEIHVSTHDAGKEILYYRWEYEEDWEIKAEKFVIERYDVPSGNLVTGLTLATSNNIYYCWGKNVSNTAILGDASQMDGAAIKGYPLLQLPYSARDSRFSYLYSIQVKQYAIRKEAYLYFDNIRKNTQNSSSIFSPIPAEMQGNIHCLENPGEAVIGYIPVTTKQESRLYINAWDVPGMIPEIECAERESSEPFIVLYGEGYGIYQYNRGYIYMPIRCVDCREHYRATKTKPPFWPNDHL